MPWNLLLVMLSQKVHHPRFKKSRGFRSWGPPFKNEGLSGRSMKTVELRERRFARLGEDLVRIPGQRFFVFERRAP